MKPTLVAALSVAASFVATSASAQFAYINADTYCGEDGNAHVSWSVDSYDAWSIAGENDEILIEIQVDGGEWTEVDRGVLALPEMHFEGSTPLPDGSLTVLARSWALVPWGNGYAPEPEPRYADNSWKHIMYATTFDVPTNCAIAPPPGVATARFWRKNTAFWPDANGVAVGGVSYTIDEAVALLNVKVHSDKTYKMTRQLIAAQINADEGNDASCVTTELADAHAWLLANPPGSDVRGRDDVWRNDGKGLMKTLREYNRGELCAPQRLGTASPRFWKNHQSAWPVTSVTLGGVNMTQADIVNDLMLTGHGDRTYRMAKVLAATELNIAVGNDGSCISQTVTDAHNWLTANPLGSDVRGMDDPWQVDGKLIISTLREYNRGRMCAPHR